MTNHHTLSGKVALITGAARRVGAVIARTLHARGMDVVIHYRHSAADAEGLRDALLAARPDSVLLLNADLLQGASLPELIRRAHAWRGRLDALINNASSFYPTPVTQVSEAQWNDLLGSNLKAPFFLAQAAAPFLREARGSIVNIADIHADRPLKEYPVYSIAKAGLVMLTKALARELAPEVRVNAVAPGAILWPEHDATEATRRYVIAGTALKRLGDPEDVARAVAFLLEDAPYMTGQVLTVDGGRSLSF
jgi:pteridine reductase